MTLSSQLSTLNWRSVLAVAPLAWLWFRFIDHLRVEWTVNPQYAHGWAVPFLCLYLLWRKVESRKQKAESPAHVSFSAFQLFSFFLLCFLYLPTRLVQEANPEWRLVSWALALEVIGITLLLLRITDHSPCTTHHASRFTFPIFFFLVAVPWPTFIEGPLVQGLMRTNVGVTIELLGLFGIPAAQHGNVIEIATGMVGVDDACSGIRSFQATLMLSLFFGELYALSAGRRALCAFAGFALSFVFNIARTTLLTWVAVHNGTAAIASWHDPAGVTILLACFLSLWALAGWLRRVQSPKSKVQSPESEAPSAVSVVRGPPVSGPVVSSQWSVVHSPVVPLSLLAWLFLVEVGTELWYRSHEWKVPTATAWHLEFPRDNATFHELPLSDKTRQFLRFDEGYNGTWQEGADQRWQAIFFRWDPGRIAAHLAKSHTPEVCLTAAGREVVSQSGLRPVAVQGLRLPFRSYVVKDQSGPLHVFYCLWEDRADAQAFRTTTMTYASRLAPVLAGRRNSGQRSLEVAIWGMGDEAQAEAALTQELQKLVKVER
jgi:exosortase